MPEPTYNITVTPAPPPPAPVSAPIDEPYILATAPIDSFAYSELTVRAGAFGEFTILGEIINTSSTKFAAVAFTISFYDEWDRLFETESIAFGEFPSGQSRSYELVV